VTPRFGVTFSDLADEERFDAAQSLLLKGRRIPEIVAVLGFAGAQRLHTRLQSLVVDETPGRWRAKHLDGRI
jgi:methylphosphotriester-DNA--protein-cysteine methyltransferase